MVFVAVGIQQHVVIVADRHESDMYMQKHKGHEDEEAKIAM
jgi:hypothetical protein